MNLRENGVEIVHAKDFDMNTLGVGHDANCVNYLCEDQKTFSAGP